jgi:hypothetical protein
MWVDYFRSCMQVVMGGPQPTTKIQQWHLENKILTMFL